MNAADNPAMMRREIRGMLKAAAAALTGKEDRGPDRRVRKHSFDVHDDRSKVFRRVGDGSLGVGRDWIEDQMRLAREILVRNRKDRELPHLTPRDLWAHEVLLRHRDFKTGRWDPSYATLMDKCCVWRATVARSLKALVAVGLICWVRRTVKVDSGGQAGPQRKQISNAYWFDPNRLAEKARAYWNERCDARRRKAAIKGVLAAKAGAASAIGAPAKPVARLAESAMTPLQKALASCERAVLAKELRELSASPG